MTAEQIKLGYAILFGAIGVVLAAMLQDYYTEKLRYQFTLKEKGIEKSCLVLSE
jgi:uncharacterized membrane protein YsdA (DUF1294 family)